MSMLILCCLQKISQRLRDQSAHPSLLARILDKLGNVNPLKEKVEEFMQ